MAVAPDRVLLLDGGMGMELVKSPLFVKGDPLWGSGMVYTHPEVVRDVHLRYLRAGADIVETNTYQASVEGFCKQFSVGTGEALEIIKSAVRLAKEARATFLGTEQPTEAPRKSVMIAGAVGPYGAHLCDRSEYSGHYVDTMTEEQLMDWHRPHIRALLEEGVDFLALETIPAQKEADALVRLLQEFPSARAWMSFSCKDNSQTVHGEPLRIAATQALLSDQIVLVGVNCVPPSAVSPLLECLRDGGKGATKGLIAYPDGLDESQLADLPSLVGAWIAQGAAVVGGCCGMSAAHIASMRGTVDSLTATTARKHC